MYSNRELICFLIICLTHDLVSAEILDLRRVSEMFTTLNSSLFEKNTRIFVSKRSIWSQSCKRGKELKILEFEEHLDHMLLQFWTWLAYLSLQMASNVSYLKDLSFHIPNSLEILKTTFSFWECILYMKIQDSLCGSISTDENAASLIPR